MPYAVSQWPYSPDPRAPDFALYGWDVGQVPPFRWTIKTTNALAPFEIFNTGVVVEATTIAPDDTTWTNVDSLPAGVTCFVRIKGTQEPVSGPPDFTILLEIELADNVGPADDGFASMEYPTAIAVHTVPTVGLPSGPDIRLPDPVTITPRKWNA